MRPVCTSTCGPASTSGRYVTQRPCPAGSRSLKSMSSLGQVPRLFTNTGQREHASSRCSAGGRASNGSSTKQPVTAPATAPALNAAAARAGSASSTSAQQSPLQPPKPSLPPMALQSLHQDDILRRSDERVRRLTTLVETRRLYRNVIRAQHLLGMASPVYTPPPPPEVDEDAAQGGAVAGGSISSGEESDGERSGNGSSRGPSAEEDKALKGALETVAEMALVSEQLKAGLRSLPAGFGGAIFSPGAEAASEERVRSLARQVALELRDRLAAELPALPVTSDGALHYIESRNAKYSRRVALDELQGGGNSSGASGAAGGINAGIGGGVGGSVVNSVVASAELGSSPRKSALERLEAAERVAGEIIANNIKPALKKASEQDFVEVVKGTSSYLKGLWVRLNGGSALHPASLAALRAGLDLPLPVGSQAESELAISQLSLDLEALEKKLQEASKNRENKLRKAGLQGRVQMAIQLKGLDAEVLHLSSSLAVRTLQLEMEHVFGSLEEEALDFFNGVQPGGLLARDGSTNELSLLVAEFAWLDEQLTLLAAALQAGGDVPSNVTGAPAGHGASAGTADAAAVAMGPALINDEVLGKLAAEIPDMRTRVGVADQTVFGGQGFSLTKARLQIKESLDKVKEAVNFLSRGLKLLGSDVATGARLFLKAALGNVLKPREVSALRRTARDILTFIPFTIILIIPLSPLGHVLVFGFIQRYFPSFFPSQFTSRRQEIMVRYEELERQLLEAQATAEAAEEEVELARAREAVARLTAPETLAGSVLGANAAASITAATATVAVAVGGGAAPPSAGGDGAVVVAGGSGPGGGNSGGGGSGVSVASLTLSSLSTTGTLSSVDEVTLQEATQKVRILAEQLDEIRDDVNLPHGDGLAPEGKSAEEERVSGSGGSGGGGGGSTSYSAARKL